MTESVTYFAIAAFAAVCALIVLVVLKLSGRSSMNLSISGFGVDIQMSTAAESAKRKASERVDRDAYESDLGGLVAHKPIQQTLHRKETHE